MVLDVENRILRNILDVESFSNRVFKDMVEVLYRSRERAMSVIAGLPDTTPFTRLHQQILLEEIDGTLLALQSRYADILTQAQLEVIRGEYASVSRSLLKEARAWDSASGEPTIDMNRLDVLLRRPLGGKTLPKWVEFGTRQLRRTIKMEIGQAIMLGESVDELRRRLQNGFDLGRRSATVLARTSLLETAKVARDEVYREHADLIVEYQYIATLDSRTCLICGPDDLKKARRRQDLPQPLRHPNCRCCIVPLTEYSREVYRPAIVNEEPYRVHHRDGSTSTKWIDKEAVQVPGNKRYEQFFRSQPEKWQKSVLGKERYAIYDANKLSLDELRTANRKRILSVEELAKEYGAD